MIVPLHRRRFLKSLGAAAVGFPLVAPATALGRADSVAPSMKTTMGFIGLGSMGGRGHLPRFLRYNDVRVVAACDVRARFRKTAKDRVDRQYGDTGCATYHDFRELLAREDIDAVLIATPDHWHGLIGIEAAKNGKAMYLEKPVDVHVAAAQALRSAVNRYGVVFQFGTQQRSSKAFRFAGELFAQFRILCCNAHRTGIEMTLAHHHAAKGDQRRCSQSKFIRT